MPRWPKTGLRVDPLRFSFFYGAALLWCGSSLSSATAKRSTLRLGGGGVLVRGLV